jgi:DNA-binding MarR family transcriptional regulator
VPKTKTTTTKDARQAILLHWRETAPNDRMAHLIRDAARSCVRALQMRLAEHSVSSGHWTFLRVLWQSDGLTQRDLSLQVGVMEPTTFTALKAMERLGYVKRKQAPNNKKNVYVCLTPKGKALKKKLVPLAEEVNEVAFRGVRRADIAVTRKTLLALIENLAADELASVNTARRVPSTREMSRRIAEMD